MATLRTRAAIGTLVFAAGLLGGCGLRQNLRNEFLSFRGAWFCDKKNCSEKSMKRSSKGTDEGGTRISHGKVQPNAALVFNAGASVETFKATVKDCKGKSMPVASKNIKKPGSHGVSGQADSWVVIIDKGDVGDLNFASKGKCATLIVTASATWAKGTSYEDKGGIKAE